MVIDPTNQTTSTLQSKPEKEVTPDAVKESNVNNLGIPEAGQTSEIAPAVVTNISAATLETSRAINAPEQTAEQNKSSDIVEAREKEQLQKVQDNSPKGKKTPQKSLLDTTA